MTDFDDHSHPETQPIADDEMLPEYDFASMPGGVRGKYAKRAQAGSNVVLLDPDVAAVFPDAEAVNFALRHLAAVMQHDSKRAG
jgi:hypothetical protein